MTCVNCTTGSVRDPENTSAPEISGALVKLASNIRSSLAVCGSDQDTAATAKPPLTGETKGL